MFKVFFQPNIIIDAILGCMWTLQLRLPPVIQLKEDPCELFDFLLQRQDAKATVLSALRKLVSPEGLLCDIAVLGSIFDKLNESYRNLLDIEIQSQIAMPATRSMETRPAAVLNRPTVVVDQTDLYARVLSDLVENRPPNDQHQTVHDRLIVTVVNEYIRSLVQYHIPVQHFIYEMLIEAFVRLGQFYQLHQLFLYHAVSDSKPLVC